MLYTLLFSIGFVAIAVGLLSVKIWLVKGGRFPNTHIGASRPLREKGITCALSTDASDRARKNLSEITGKRQFKTVHTK